MRTKVRDNITNKKIKINLSISYVFSFRKLIRAKTNINFKFEILKKILTYVYLCMNIIELWRIKFQF